MSKSRVIKSAMYNAFRKRNIKDLARTRAGICFFLLSIAEYSITISFFILIIHKIKTNIYILHLTKGEYNTICIMQRII